MIYALLSQKCAKNAQNLVKCAKFFKNASNFFNFLKMRQKLPLCFGNVSKPDYMVFLTIASGVTLLNFIGMISNF